MSGPTPVFFKLKPTLTREERDTFLPLCQEGLAKVPFGTRQVMGSPLSDAMTKGFEYGVLLRALTGSTDG